MRRHNSILWGVFVVCGVVGVSGWGVGGEWSPDDDATDDDASFYDDSIDSTDDASVEPLVLQKFLANESWTGASSCLDGSEFGAYIRQPLNSSGNLKFVIFFQGGGACYTQDGCEKRSKTPLGSSKMWHKHFRDETNVLARHSWNPFHGWTHVFVPYCTGDTHLGGDVGANGWGLRFAGRHNVDSVRAWLDATTPIQNATDILVAGSSAGGIAALHHADAFLTHYPHATVKSTPQGGYFFPRVSIFPAYSLGLFIPPFQEFVMQTWNCKDTFNSECLKHHQEDPWECFNAYEIYPYISTPLFFAQNLFDSNQILGELFAPDNTSGVKFVEYYGRTMKKNISQVFGEDGKVNKNKKGSDGLYAVSCFEHTDNLNFATPTPLFDKNTNMTYVYRDMLEDWYFNRTHIPHALIDGCYEDGSLPCNLNCGSYPGKGGREEEEWWV